LFSRQERSRKDWKEQVKKIVLSFRQGGCPKLRKIKKSGRKKDLEN